MPIVRIEFQRVQTWLFAVPRLRVMVGANALIGDVLRNRLKELACRPGQPWATQNVIGQFPAADRNDPLESHDDPSVDASEGILSRDGGHFDVQLSVGAEEFRRAASELIAELLPGLRAAITVEDPSNPLNNEPSVPVSLSDELPVLEPCEWSGRSVASVRLTPGDDQVDVSLGVAKRYHAATAARNDIAGLLINTTKLAKKIRPELELEQLTRGGYLAVIHADGNGVGRAAPDDAPGRAAFHHRNRVLVRRALQYAINCRSEKKPGEIPLVPLMVGGDDVLVIARAGSALPFAVELCAELERLQKDRQRDDFHLTLGVGVVFAKHNIPFHRLHEIAEELASSAKTRYRGFTAEREASVADWAVYTASWIDTAADIRKRDWIRGTPQRVRVLSQRPMNVLGDTLDTVQGLVQAAEALHTCESPRSQLRYLVDQLPRGKALAELAFQELSPGAKHALKKIGLDKLWKDAGNGATVTPALDLIEVFEIENLGRSGAADNPKRAKETANA